MSDSLLSSLIPSLMLSASVLLALFHLIPPENLLTLTLKFDVCKMSVFLIPRFYQAYIPGFEEETVCSICNRFDFLFILPQIYLISHVQFADIRGYSRLGY